jgi:hypothetical protein
MNYLSIFQDFSPYTYVGAGAVLVIAIFYIRIKYKKNVKTTTKTTNKVNQSGANAGGDIVGRDKN